MGVPVLNGVGNGFKGHEEGKGGMGWLVGGEGRLSP